MSDTVRLRCQRGKGKAARRCAETVNGGDSLWKALEKEGDSSDPTHEIATRERLGRWSDAPVYPHPSREDRHAAPAQECHRVLRRPGTTSSAAAPCRAATTGGFCQSIFIGAAG